MDQHTRVQEGTEVSLFKAAKQNTEDYTTYEYSIFDESLSELK